MTLGSALLRMAHVGVGATWDQHRAACARRDEDRRQFAAVLGHTWVLSAVAAVIAGAAGVLALGRVVEGAGVGPGSADVLVVAFPVLIGIALLVFVGITSVATSQARAARRSWREWRAAARRTPTASWPAWSLDKGPDVETARRWVRTHLEGADVETALVLARGSDLTLGELVVVAASLGPDT